MISVVVISFLVFEFDFLMETVPSVNYSEKLTVNCRNIFDDSCHFYHFAQNDWTPEFDQFHFEVFSHFPHNHFWYYILETEFLLLLASSAVNIFVAIVLVVCYEMNFSSVLVDLKLDFDQLYF